MTLIDTITNLVAKTLKDEGGWYTWGIPKALPTGISVSEASIYEQNRSLKRQLATAYKTGSDDRKMELTQFFIFSWGGVHGNSEDNLKAYALENPDSLISKGPSGVASWSKALAMREPDTYAIYDARVACSLNGLQVIDSIQPACFFPVLPSQNKVISATNSAFTEFANSHNWTRLSNTEFYTAYLDVLKKVAKEVKTDIMTVEMVLFAKAEVFAQAAFPKG